MHGVTPRLEKYFPSMWLNLESARRLFAVNAARRLSALTALSWLSCKRENNANISFGFEEYKKFAL
jgi:hypothetical protein